VGTAPAGAVYCEVVCAVLGYTTGGGGGLYDFTCITLAPQPNSLSETPDGGGRYAAIEPNADQTAGKPLSSLGGRTMDYIGDSATRFAAAQAGADKTSSNTAADTAKVNGVASSSVSPIADLMPAEAGAEKTAGKSLTVLTDRNLGNVDDGGGRYGVHQVDGNGLAVIDFSQSAHVNKNLDNILPTASYARTPAISWTPEVVQNASFTSPAAADGTIPGWTGMNGMLSIVPAGGPLALRCVLLANGVGGAYESTSHACQPGEVVSATVTCDTTAGNSTARAQIQVFDASGSQLTPAGAWDVAVNIGYNTFQTASLLATMPANAASFRIFVYASSNAGTTFLLINPRCSVNDVRVPGSSKAYVDFTDNTSGGHVGKHLDNVGDGPSGNRSAIGNADIFVSGGVNRVGLRVAGSGHTLGDQRNLLPVTWAGVRSVLSTSPITFSITAGSPNSTVNFSTTAFTNYGGGVTVNYNAASVSHGQVNGTTATYYLFFRDPTSAGGSQTLNVTVFPQTLAQYPDAVLVGSCVVTVASGGGGSGGSGSGGGGYCVADDMLVAPGRVARDASIGDSFDCVDWPTSRLHTFARKLLAVEYHYTECVRLVTDGGAELDCGVTTPFDLLKPDGGVIKRAPDMLGEQVITDCGVQTVTHVIPIGVRRVCFFHFGGISYAAGRDRRPIWLRCMPQWLLPRKWRLNRIYSHNAGVSKP